MRFFHCILIRLLFVAIYFTDYFIIILRNTHKNIEKKNYIWIFSGLFGEIGKSPSSARLTVNFYALTQQRHRSDELLRQQ